MNMLPFPQSSVLQLLSLAKSKISEVFSIRFGSSSNVKVWKLKILNEVIHSLSLMSENIAK